MVEYKVPKRQQNWRAVRRNEVSRSSHLLWLTIRCHLYKCELARWVMGLQWLAFTGCVLGIHHTQQQGAVTSWQALAKHFYLRKCWSQRWYLLAEVKCKTSSSPPPVKPRSRTHHAFRVCLGRQSEARPYGELLINAFTCIAICIISADSCLALA